MNLKSHTAYPQIDINPHNVFTVQFIDGKGKTKFEDMGAGKTREEARAKAKAMVAKEQSKFVKGKK